MSVVAEYNGEATEATSTMPSREAFELDSCMERKRPKHHHESPSPPPIDNAASPSPSHKAVKLANAEGISAENEFYADCLITLWRGGALHRHDQSTPPRPPPSRIMSYECSLCGKAFPSYQALGGHKSTHRNPATPAPDADGATTETARGNRKKAHKCSTCGRSFPSGQALGGHMRCHFNGITGGARFSAKSSVMAAASSSKEGSGKDMGFDLNEFPPPLDLTMGLGFVGKCRKSSTEEGEALSPLTVSKKTVLTLTPLGRATEEVLARRSAALLLTASSLTMEEEEDEKPLRVTASEGGSHDAPPTFYKFI